MRADLQSVLALLIGTVALTAAGREQQEEQQEEPPSLEFIEYLGSLIEGEDGWITPQDLRREDELRADVIATRTKEQAAEVEKQP